ncbi:ARM-like repeat-containing protein [Ophiocordyceps camponoti-floridani]|uniref:ARM-like repeat-containing protein n=1 Tax=Ophiocordyceps camponoti-floridani TaxID=2030778 RepID=A0A8H4VD72_9HYPO|nr:ARM-like repeat-containing protein [Ophiocordyceps camponoti-floridani]
MPKSRRSRGGPRHRRDPVSRPVKPPSDPRLAALREAKVLPAVQHLSSADTRARSAAAAAVAALVQDGECRKLLLREHIVHTLLTQTLTDAALESRSAGWGILQVLAQKEDDGFCIHLFRQDVITSMDHAARATIRKLQSGFDSLPKAEKPFVISVAASLISLATALADASDDAWEAIAANGSIAQLLAFAVGQFPDQPNPIASLRTDALACLMMLCEDNVIFSSELAKSPCFTAIMALKDEADADGVLACAVLHNLFAAMNESDHTLEADDSVLVSTLTKAISPTDTPPQDPSTVVSGGWCDPLEQQRLALEVLGSIGTNLIDTSTGTHRHTKAPGAGKKVDQDMDELDEPGSDAEEPTREEDNDEKSGEDELMDDLEMLTDGDADKDADDLPVLRALVQTALPQLVRLARQPRSRNDEDAQSLALSALSNIAWSASVVDFTDSRNAAIQKAWTPVARSLWRQLVTPIMSSDTADMKTCVQITSLAWALSRALPGQAPVTDKEPRKFMELYTAIRGITDCAADSPDRLQFPSVKCIGALGQLARDPAPLDVNREIGSFLIGLVAALPATSPSEAIEALFQLFEIYGDERHACDGLVFWKEGFLARLEETLPKVRAAAKDVDGKEEPELRARADDALLNLGRFLAYKRKHAPSDFRREA